MLQSVIRKSAVPLKVLATANDDRSLQDRSQFAVVVRIDREAATQEGIVNALQKYCEDGGFAFATEYAVFVIRSFHKKKSAVLDERTARMQGVYFARDLSRYGIKVDNLLS